MAKLTYHNEGTKVYETGVKDGVLFVYDKKEKKYGTGVAWQGLTAVTESPSGAEPTALYADDVKYLNLLSTEEFGASIEAYTYPDEFAVCDGSAAITTGSGKMYVGQQSRRTFALAYKTTVGNDTEGNDYAYKLHLIYGCLAAPSEKAYATINDSPEAITFSWEVSTTPVSVVLKEGDTNVTYKPTASVTLSSVDFMNEDGELDANFVALLDYIYGTDAAGENQGTDPTLPMPADVYALLTTGKVEAAA